jgi:large subunit ribosomal protein L20
LHAWKYAFRDRRKKKSEFRALWQVKVNAAARAAGLSYSRLIDALKKAEIKLDRKILAHLAEHHPQIFEKLVGEVKK